MNKEELYAVLTGDIVDSRKFKGNWELLLKIIKESLSFVENYFSKHMKYSFEISGGDSFQTVILNIEEALLIAISLRASLRYFCKARKVENSLDARIAIGIGEIDYLPQAEFDTSSTGSGEAFHLSRPYLDKVKKGNQRLFINSPWKEINSEFDVECSLLDEIIKKWSSKSAEAILYKMVNFTQEKMAKVIGITQPAVNGRLRIAGANPIDKLCDRYKKLIIQKIGFKTYNH